MLDRVKIVIARYCTQRNKWGSAFNESGEALQVHGVLSLRPKELLLQTLTAVFSAESAHGHVTTEIWRRDIHGNIQRQISRKSKCQVLGNKLTGQGGPLFSV